MYWDSSPTKRPNDRSSHINILSESQRGSVVVSWCVVTDLMSVLISVTFYSCMGEFMQKLILNMPSKYFVRTWPSASLPIRPWSGIPPIVYKDTTPTQRMFLVFFLNKNSDILHINNICILFIWIVENFTFEGKCPVAVADHCRGTMRKLWSPAGEQSLETSHLI